MKDILNRLVLLFFVSGMITFYAGFVISYTGTATINHVTVPCYDRQLHVIRGVVCDDKKVHYSNEGLGVILAGIGGILGILGFLIFISIVTSEVLRS